ncbi:PREDICTED: uncharacterized protein LOC104608664 isoform X2 [Nelumbo nucifera]|uniref:Uncharacterized protein LOC104608664 isoform X2 n=1 Tax=Nelumbo nucifera TaxID=4432 RepID=A0A1U8B1H1_NELNU|nr:PREDICTED: uncharacterized protein LOC104608664 isoform X2 [Nelumbo nucifera]
MEALKKLEEVQRMLAFMQTRGLSSSHHDSDRFLADFMLFMVQPSGMLNMYQKCHLMSELLAKISAEVFEEAVLWLTGESYEQNCAEQPSQLCLDNKIDLGSLRANTEEIAMVGLDAIERANSTLEDFCRSYFMFHEMDVSRPRSIFRYLPVLSFTESYIYQLDSFNEKILHSSPEGLVDMEGGSKHLSNIYKERKQGITNSLLENFIIDPFRPLVLLIEQHGLLTERIRAELNCGKEYWALERKLCHALLGREEVSIEDVMRAIHLKSFDYRVLNLLLYKLRGKPVIFLLVNDLHMEFLSISEFLVEVSDDLFDYEDDVTENNFNILRMFVRIYGASAAPTMLAKCISEAEEKYKHLSKLLDPELSSNYWRRCEEATREGGKLSGHSLGAWSIPPIISDEELYRSNLLGSSSASLNRLA